MNVMNPPIKFLNAPSPDLSESETRAFTRRKLALWGAMFVVMHFIIGVSLQHPPALKPFVPDVWWELLAAKAIELIILALLLPILLVRDGLTLADVGFGPTRWQTDVRVGILGGAAIWFMHSSLLKLAAVGTGVANINTGMLSTVATLSDAPVEILGLIIGIVVVGPLLEEVVYRGCLMSSVRAALCGRPSGMVVAAFFSGICFSMFHALGHPLYYAVYFVTGLSFALFYQRTGSLGASFVAHGCVNALCVAGAIWR